MRLSAFHLEIALAYYRGPTALRALGPHLETTEAHKVIDWMVAEELLEPERPGSDELVPTERMAVWIEHMAETPLPVVRWVRGEAA